MLGEATNAEPNAVVAVVRVVVVAVSRAAAPDTAPLATPQRKRRRRRRRHPAAGEPGAAVAVRDGLGTLQSRSGQGI